MSMQQKMMTTESKPNIKLKEIQELGNVETKFYSLKSQLEYMKSLYKGAVPIMQNVVEETISKTKYSEHDLFENQISLSSESLTKNIKSCDLSQNQNSLHKSSEVINSYHLQDKEIQKKSPKIIPVKSIDIHQENYQPFRDNANDVTTKVQHPCSKNITAEIQQDMMNIQQTTNSKMNILNEDSKLCENEMRKEYELGNEDQKIPNEFDKLSEFKVENKKKKTIYSTVNPKRIQTCHMNNILLQKHKKKKGKLRNSNSKGTICTKDEILIPILKQDTKKKKHRTVHCDNMKKLVNKPQNNLKDVVEIYHNVALKNEAAVVSEKQIAYDSSSKNVNKNSLFHDNSQKVKNPLHLCQLYAQKSNEDTSKKKLNKDIKSDDQIIKDEANNPSHPSEYFNKQQYQLSHNNYNFSSMVTHNYEMPTLASKLKTTNKGYYNRFHFRSIPFVVGTSISPSHNLGLNIQEVLSIMKTKQPTVSGLTPLLIRKVSRGMEPVSALLEINDNSVNEKFVINCENGIDDGSKNCEPNVNNQIVGKTESVASRFTKLPTTQSTIHSPSVMLNKDVKNRFCMSTSVLQEEGSKEHGFLVPNKNTSQIKTNKSVTSQINLKSPSVVFNSVMEKSVNNTEKNYTNCGSRDIDAFLENRDGKGIKDLCIKLHDEFEEMNSKCEKLRDEVEKTGDIVKKKKLTDIEKELQYKEDEINALIDMYKELVGLKTKMKMMTDKNNFAYFPTEMQGFNMPQILLGPRMQYPHNTMQMCHWRKRNVSREPSTSIRLAGLLRRIQSFQKQLKS